MAEIHIALNCDREQTLTAELQRVVMGNNQVRQPSGMTLSKLHDAGIAPQFGFHMLVVDNNVALNAHDEIALVLGTTQGTCRVDNSGAPYTGGAIFSQDQAGSMWVDEESLSIEFEALVR